METFPEVSILMPVYNEELYLSACIESIISQTFEDWELIMVDDFSTDDSLLILGQFVKKDSRISVHKNAQKGIIPALEMAFRHSKGRMITRMDGDDIMPANKMLSLFQNLIALGSGNIVSGKVKYFSDDQLKEGFLNYENWVNEQNYFGNIYKECTLPSACWMAYKDDLLEINAFSESQYPEDYDLLFRFYRKGYKIYGIDEVLHLWRDHPERASRNDPNYADQNFFPLKIDYFMKVDHDKSTDLFLWGAGKKGKSLAKLLLAQQIPFRWVTGNQKKIGKHIYNVLLENSEELSLLGEKQILIAISDVNFQSTKSETIAAINTGANQYFYFC